MWAVRIQKIYDKEYCSQLSLAFEEFLKVLQKSTFDAQRLKKEDFHIEHHLSLPSSDKDVLLFDIIFFYQWNISFERSEGKLSFRSCKILKKSRSGMRDTSKSDMNVVRQNHNKSYWWRKKTIDLSFSDFFENQIVSGSTRPSKQPVNRSYVVAWKLRESKYDRG